MSPHPPTQAYSQLMAAGRDSQFPLEVYNDHHNPVDGLMSMSIWTAQIGLGELLKKWT